MNQPSRRPRSKTPEPRPLDDLPVSWLRLFTRVFELQSFTVAARATRISQPVASRQVATLEARLGVLLFVRSTRKVTPTEAGRLLYEQVREILEGIDHVGHLVDDLASLAHGIRGHLRVAAPSAFGRRFVAPVANRFLADHPGARLELLLSDRHIDLIEHAVDLGVRVGPLPDLAMRAVRVGESALVVVAHPRRLASLRRPLDLAGLAALPALLPIPVPPTLGPLDLSRLDVRLKTDDLEALLAAVLDDVGVSILPRWLVAPHLESGDLVSPVELPLPKSPIHLVYPGGARVRSPLVRAFSDAVTAALSRLTPTTGSRRAGP